METALTMAADVLAERLKPGSLNAFIEVQVLAALGEPAALLRVQVRPLWKDRYRVNVFIGPDAASAVVAHSYFVEADTAGIIVRTTPQLTKRY